MYIMTRFYRSGAYVIFFFLSKTIKFKINILKLKKIEKPDKLKKLHKIVDKRIYCGIIVMDILKITHRAVEKYIWLKEEKPHRKSEQK